MKIKPLLSITVIFILISSILNVSFANQLVDQIITIHSNERFDLVQTNKVNFKFQPLSEDARKLEITNNASSLGVAYLGQVKLKENITALSALRSIADQIGESLGIHLGVIADSNTSQALKTNELLLLYHPRITMTLVLAKPTEESDYEIICTYALKEIAKAKTTSDEISSENIEAVNKSSNDAQQDEDVQVNQQEN